MDCAQIQLPRRVAAYNAERNWYITLRSIVITRPARGSFNWVGTRSNYIHYAGIKNMSRLQPVTKPQQRAIMCLLIAAHNEELVLESTLRSAVAAGMKREHIYVVDDNSSDGTSRVARTVLPRENVMRVRRSGKGLALTKAAKKFQLTNEYRWIHLADADGVFAPNYFTVFRKGLRVKFAAATGYIKSLPGKRVSEYRVFEYTVGMELHRRIQSLLGVISIIPGPTSCFRADVFDKLDFSTKVLTEDFDVTLQIHRQGLGEIQFIPEAVAYTQDPLTIRTFVKQVTRWNRGVMQVMRRHGIGKRLQRIDAYLSYQLLQSLLLFVNCFIWVPIMTATHGGPEFLAVTFLLDVLLTFFINLAVAARSKRWDVVAAFPIIYGMKWIVLGVFMKAFVEVMILGKFKVTDGTWDNEAGRRYAIRPA